MVAEQPTLSFAGLVRQLRADAGLTQEELAEAAGLPVRTLSDLEREVTRTAHKDTAGLLADALSLAAPVRVLFIAAARGKAPAESVLDAARKGVVAGAFAAAVARGLPRDLAAFTGRQAELSRLLEALAVRAGGGVVGICTVDGMAGVGKTTFAVHAAHRLTATFPDGQYFLPLHAHTAGQRPVEPVDALGSLLLAAGVPAAAVPPGLEARAARWRDHVADKKVLLLLDDAAGHAQVRPLLPGTASSLVLVTSRRRLAALEDATVTSLDVLPAGEAAVLLARLAARSAIGAGDAAVGEIARLCGYLPLAIGMAASQLRHHSSWTADSLVSELAQARDRLAVMRAENLSVAAAFGLSYADLTPDQQRLFRRLGLVPGPSVDGYAAAALDDSGVDEARRNLDELYDQHLLSEPAPGRYQLHDLLRQHARTLAAADDPAETGAATGRLLDYYLHTALAAGQHFASWVSAYRRRPPGHPPAQAPGLSTPAQAGAWLEIERPNLHATADHAAASAQLSHAIAISGAISGFLAAKGHWDQSAAVIHTALTAARRSGDRLGEADTLGDLGVMQQEAGDYTAAAASLARALTLYSAAGDLPGQAYVFNQVGFLRALTGDYPAAAASHRHALALARRASDRLAEADGLQSLGMVQQMAGDHTTAAASLQQALALFRDLGNLQGQANTLNCLGVVQQEIGDHPAAAASQQQALELFRGLGDRRGQSYVFNDLGIVQQETGDYQAAAASHQQALELFRDLGQRLGEAEALNRLGELSTRISATSQARDQHSRALAIARDLSAAPEEARALEGIGNSHLHEGNPGRAAEYLRQALAICQRIGAPAAERIQETLHHHGLTVITTEHEATPPNR